MSFFFLTELRVDIRLDKSVVPIGFEVCLREMVKQSMDNVLILPLCLKRVRIVRFQFLAFGSVNAYNEAEREGYPIKAMLGTLA